MRPSSPRCCSRELLERLRSSLGRHMESRVRSLRYALLRHIIRQPNSRKAVFVSSVFDFVWSAPRVPPGHGELQAGVEANR